MTDAEIRRVLREHRALLKRARYGGIDPEHALLLLLLGERKLTVGQLTWDCYFGTNAVYALNQLEEMKLIKSEPGEDRRMRVISRMPAGATVAREVRALLARQAA